MILNDEPIDLASLAGALGMLPEIGYLRPPPGTDALAAAPEAFAQARTDFRQHVQDNYDRENAIRRALCYVLNLDDTGLEAFALQARMPFPNRDVGQKRAWLESLWAHTFADWRVVDFTPASFEVTPPR